MRAYVVVVLLIFLLSPVDSESNRRRRRCKVGSTFFDGCNLCRCARGTSVCTLRACIGGPSPVGDSFRPPGNVFSPPRPRRPGRRHGRSLPSGDYLMWP